MQMSGQCHAQSALTPEIHPLVPTKHKVGWAPEPVQMHWRRDKNPFSTPGGNQTLVIQTIF